MNKNKVKIISAIVIPLLAILVPVLIWVVDTYREANDKNDVIPIEDFLIDSRIKPDRNGNPMIEQRSIYGGGGNGTVTKGVTRTSNGIIIEITRKTNDTD